MRQLQGENLKKLMAYLHEAVNQTADTVIENIQNNKLDKVIDYPPGSALSANDMNILAQIRSIKGFDIVLRKILRDCASYPLFDLFSIIDGTSDVEGVNYDFLDLVECKNGERKERDDFLHDYFFETYWDWESEKV